VPLAGGVKVCIVEDEVDQAVPTPYPPVDGELAPATSSMTDNHEFLCPARPVGCCFVLTKLPALFLWCTFLPPPPLLDDLAGLKAT
jgi:hypothetical protein